MGHAAASSVQVRDPAERRAAAPHAPLCWVVPLRVQPGARPAKGALRTGGEETQLPGFVPVAHTVAKRHRDVLVGGRAHPFVAAGAERSRARLPELLCAPRALPALQAQGTLRALSLPRSPTIQGRPGQPPALFSP